MLLSDLRNYDIRDYDHEVRAQFPNPIGTPQRHRMKLLRFKFNKARSANEQRGNSHMAKSVEEKKVVEKKAKKEEVKKWGTKEVAKQLGVDPKFFRTVLRANNMGSDGQRYEWEVGDPLKKERRLIEDYREKQEERKANAAEKTKKEKAGKKTAKTEKKAEKKASKANGRKAAKEEPDEEVEEGEEEEVFEEA